jgi:hypothetical protein
LFAINNIQLARRLKVKIASLVIPLISVRREREANEIIPTRAEQSSDWYDNPYDYGAHNAIDLDLDTDSHTSGQESAPWLKLTFNQVFCVKKVKWLGYRRWNSHDTTWTCSNTGCSSCNGAWCNQFTVTVTISEGASSEDVIPATGCKYGDSVKLHSKNDYPAWAYEIVVIKQGELT